MAEPRLAEAAADQFVRSRTAIAPPTDRPLVTLAWAQSRNGSITTQRGLRTTISGPESQQFTHYLRARHDAILVGVGTLLSDDPRLTVRLVEGHDPRPVVLDSQLRTPPHSRLVDDRRPLIFHAPDAPADRLRALVAAGVEPVAVPAAADGRLDLAVVLASLVERTLGSLMVEGGARVIEAFISSGRVDLVAVTVSDRTIDGYGPHPGLDSLELFERRAVPVGQDTVVIGRLA